MFKLNVGKGDSRRSNNVCSSTNMLAMHISLGNNIHLHLGLDLASVTIDSSKSVLILATVLLCMLTRGMAKSYTFGSAFGISLSAGLY